MWQVLLEGLNEACGHFGFEGAVRIEQHADVDRAAPALPDRREGVHANVKDAARPLQGHAYGALD
jgi:hypothetical protein